MQGIASLSQFLISFSSISSFSEPGWNWYGPVGSFARDRSASVRSRATVVEV